MSTQTGITKGLEDQFLNAEWGATQLESIKLFKQFTHEELTHLYDKGEVRVLPPDAYAVIEGEPSRGVYLILHGTVSVYKNDSETGSMVRIAYLEKGASFGEMSLFENAPRSATVGAATHCYLFYIDVAVFESFLQEVGTDAQIRFYKTCAQQMSERFRIINNDYIISQQLLWKYALRRANDGLEDKEEATAVG